MDERHLEQAEQLDQMVRDAGINRIRAQQAQPGQPYCDDCDEPIPPERRAANPAAHRCIYCQNAFELINRGIAK